MADLPGTSVKLLGVQGKIIDAEKKRGLRCGACGERLERGFEFVKIDAVVTPEGPAVVTGSAFLCDRDSCAVLVASMKTDCSGFREVSWSFPPEDVS
jgi:hypothetical protein